MRATTEAKIERAAVLRREAWERGDVAEAQRQTARLETLYTAKRTERARASEGSPASIQRRARIEQELEKLASGP